METDRLAKVTPGVSYAIEEKIQRTLWWNKKKVQWRVTLPRRYRKDNSKIILYSRIQRQGGSQHGKAHCYSSSIGGC
jgi:aspartyl/asparaginyl beta-hydroxylase (cupin superfamily)